MKNIPDWISAISALTTVILAMTTIFLGSRSNKQAEKINIQTKKLEEENLKVQKNLQNIQKLSVQPSCFVEFLSMERGKDSFITLNICNKGQGTMKVRKLEKLQNSKFINFQPREFYKKVEERKLLRDFEYWDLPETGRSILAENDDKWTLLKFSAHSKDQLRELERLAYNELPEIRITYTNIFGEEMEKYVYNIQESLPWLNHQ